MKLRYVTPIQKETQMDNKQDEQSLPSADITHLVRLFASGKCERAQMELEQRLQNTDQLSEADILMLNHLKEVWTKATQQNFEPPAYYSQEDVQAMLAKCRVAIGAGDAVQGMRYAWMCFQYCASGTIAYQLALCQLVDCAALFGDMKFAQAAAELYLSHFELVYSAAAYPFTPVGVHEPSNIQLWQPDKPMPSFAYPVQAAIRGVANNSSSCWTRILERFLYTLDVSKKLHRDALEALKNCYIRTGSQEDADRLLRDFPDE